MCRSDMTEPQWFGQFTILSRRTRTSSSAIIRPEKQVLQTTSQCVGLSIPLFSPLILIRRSRFVNEMQFEAEFVHAQFSSLVLLESRTFLFKLPLFV